MNKLITALTILLCFVGRLQAQSTNRGIIIMQDSTKKLTIKNYEKFSFRDSTGYEYSGTIFIPNDSQFYFIDYFKEKKGRTFHIREIKSVEYLDIGYDDNKKHQKMYLGAIPVILIAVFVPYVGVPYLIIRELYLYTKYGPGHAYNPRKHPVYKKLKNPNVTIIHLST